MAFENNNYKKKDLQITGWIIILSFILMIIIVAFLARFFKSENKIKIIFDKNQNISFLICITNNQNEIISSFVSILNTKTNRLSNFYFLPDTYIQFSKNNKPFFSTIRESLNNGIAKENIKQGFSFLLGYNINYYIFLNSNNFIRFIDLLGGIDIYTSPISFPEKNILYPDGIIKLDGDKSLEYITFSGTNENEYETLKRVSNFVNSFTRTKDKEIKRSLDKHITQFYYPLITTDLSEGDFLFLYKNIYERISKNSQDFSKGSVTTIVYCDKDKIENKIIFLPKKSGNWVKNELKESLYTINKDIIESVSDSNKIVLSILNGTDIVGFALRTKTYIESYGFDVLQVDNADNNNYEKTTIIAKKSEAKANKLAKLINCKNIFINEDQNSPVDVVLILGKDFDGKIVK